MEIASISGKRDHSQRAEGPGVHVPPEGVRRPVIIGAQGVGDVEYGDLAPAPVLQELGVVDRAVMIHHVDRVAVFAHHEVGRVAQRPTVQSVQRHLAAGDDGVGGVIVGRIEGSVEGNRVEEWQSSAGDQDVPLLGRRLLNAVGCREEVPQRRALPV